MSKTTNSRIIKLKTLWQVSLRARHLPGKSALRNLRNNLPCRCVVAACRPVKISERSHQGSWVVNNLNYSILTRKLRTQRKERCPRLPRTSLCIRSSFESSDDDVWKQLQFDEPGVCLLTDTGVMGGMVMMNLMKENRKFILMSEAKFSSNQGESITSRSSVRKSNARARSRVLMRRRPMLFN